LFGWRVAGDIPAISQCVVIVAPHTSNWDFPVCIFTMFAVGLRLTWYGKHTLFRFPVKSLLHWFGGEPIDRSVAGGHVESAIERFGRGTPWVLGVSPEGTRKRVERWKLGFYRIAVGAAVPVVPVSLDYGHHLVTIGSPVTMTGDEAKDLPALAAHFRPEMAKYPDHYAGWLGA
jgi:1-acyl-sn-glycerol-3-phosphate acyltransferase